MIKWIRSIKKSLSLHQDLGDVGRCEVAREVLELFEKLFGEKLRLVGRS